MDRQSVRSSNISSIGYDEKNEILEIEFLSGGIYQYLDVPNYVFEELMDAESQGKYFNAYVKDNYETTKIR
ncbi:KTSC domain-containing protein [Flavobacterium cucumis]|uniref:KTSC domain-containing protein n=1 Tax=Flavobacterium cucumis TaxID=416016 RepID=A0A1M7ZZH7_9FLAO|nr:KTSC domain-containing protein [Flavobacterium cucumis]SHO74266.1 KTSC domain-containing protein [Flavobacterium cucumis]